jgi:hypothetical protein
MRRRLQNLDFPVRLALDKLVTPHHVRNGLPLFASQKALDPQRNSALNVRTNGYARDVLGQGYDLGQCLV